MGFLLNLDFLKDLAPPGPGTSGPQGLDLAAEAIDDVIKRIDEEMAELLPVEFAFAGSIQSASFGGADSAPHLALHYSRAHEVIWKTLYGVKQDLETFQEACRTAKLQIVDTDQDAADRQNAIVTTLEAGSSGQSGNHAHQQARQGQDVNGPEED